MKELIDMKDLLSERRPVKWDVLPDIELYKDQVLSFMERQQVMESEEEQLTGAMINNYVKRGLLPRAKGKKYTRNHIAYLTAICSIKQILSVGETDELLKMQIGIGDAKKFYEEYWRVLDEAFNTTAEQISGELSKEQLSTAALKLAVESYAQKIACKKILEILKNK